MYNLFLDDYRTLRHVAKYTGDKDYVLLDWTICRTYEEFTNCIKEKGLPDLISFDHDLNKHVYMGEIPYHEMTEKTGYHCAEWLINYCKITHFQIPKYKIHTMNPIGETNIKELLESYKATKK